MSTRVADGPPKEELKQRNTELSFIKAGFISRGGSTDMMSGLFSRIPHERWQEEHKSTQKKCGSQSSVSRPGQNAVGTFETPIPPQLPDAVRAQKTSQYGDAQKKVRGLKGRSGRQHVTICYVVLYYNMLYYIVLYYII